MPVTVSHNLTATTPDNPAYEIRPSHWNDAHAVSMSATNASEVYGVFSNDAAYNVSFTTIAGNKIVASANVTAAPSPVNVTGANGSSVNAQTIAFSNSNGMTLGVSTAANGATVTGSYTVPTQTAFVLSNSNGVSFGTNGSTVTATVATNYMASNQSSNFAATGFTTTTVAGSVVAGTHDTAGLKLAVPAYLTTARGSTDAIGLNTAKTNVTWTANSAGISLDAGGYAGTTSGFTGANISASITHNTAGLAMSMSVGAAGGAASETAYFAGNTTVNSSGTQPLSSLQFKGYGIVSVGFSNSSYLISTPDPVTLSPSWYAVGNTTGASSSTTLAPDTISIQGTGGVSVGYSNGSIVISGNTGGGGGATSGGFYALGNTTQNSSTTLPISAQSFNGLGAMTVGYSNGSIQLSAPATSSLVAGANITVSTNGSTISIIGASVAAAPIGISAGTVTNTYQTITFSNSNGISFGLGTGGSAGVITASHNAITTGRASTDAIGLNTAQSNVTWTVDSSGLSLDARGYVGTATGFTGTNVSATMTHNSAGFSLQLSAGAGGGGIANAAGTQTATSGTVVFSNSNGISFGMSNSSVVTASYTVPSTAGLLSAVNVSAGTTSQNLSAFTLSNSNGLAFGLNGSVVTGSYTVPTQSQQPMAASGSNGSFTANTLSFSNANGVSFGTSAGSAITASYTVPTVTQYFSATNTTFNGANISGSMTLNTNGLNLSMSVAAPGGGAAVTASASNGSFTAGLLAFSNGNNVTFGTSAGSIITASVAAPGAAAENNWVNLLGANTAGNTTASGSTIGYSGINLTLSGTNGSVVNISAPATSSLVGFRGLTVSTAGSTISVGPTFASYFDNFNGEWPNSTVIQPLQSTSAFADFLLDNPLSFGFIRIPMSAALVAASTTAATTGNTQFSYGQTRSHNFVIYSRGSGASSLSLQSVASTQFTDQQSQNVSANANSTQFSYTNRATYQMSTGPVGFTMDYSSSAASLNFHTSGMTALTGLKIMEFPWATSLAPGQYWMAYGVSSSTNSQFTNVGTLWQNRFSQYGMSQPNLAFGTIGAATNSSVGPYFGVGSFTTAGGGTTASLPISAISTTGSHNKMFFAMANIA